MEVFQKQLYQYLELFTTADAHKMVLANRAAKSFETWRAFSDKGRSRRPEHVHQLRKAVHHPTGTAKLVEIEGLIATWEANRDHFERIAEETVREGDQVLIVMEMCPRELKEHLETELRRLKGAGPGETYSAIKLEIHDWVARHGGVRAPAGGLAEVTGADEGVSEDYDLELTGNDKIDSQNLFAAIVRKTGMKVKAGKGTKGGGKAGGDGPTTRPAPDHSELECHGCGEKGHIKRNCPNMDATMKGAAAKAAGKGGKGTGPWNPSASWWRSVYPGPTKGQWNDWFPGKGGSKGGKNGGPRAPRSLRALHPCSSIYKLLVPPLASPR